MHLQGGNVPKPSVRHDDRAGRGDLASAVDDLLRRGYRSKSPNGAIGNARSLQGAGAHGQADNMIVLFTDFGLHGPYTGQMKAVLHQMAPGIPIIDLFADAPVGNPKASAYLLAAYAAWFPVRTVWFA